jgi:SRSO17 transposase
VAQRQPTPQEIAGWAQELAAVGTRLQPHFVRAEPRTRALAYLQGLLSTVERKNGWQLAEHAGDDQPYGVQHLLGRAVWDADVVRDDLTRYVAEHLGHPDGVLVVDETGFLKKGERSAGVARQYSGTAGRIENCQIGVFLGYVTRHGRTLLDRELYLPKEWAQDKKRRAAAGIPQSVRFATKLELAQQMIRRALDGGVPVRWVTADAVYGTDYTFRAALEERGLGYVVGVRSDHYVWVGLRQVQVRTLVADVPVKAWQRCSCGDGAKGPRVYDWASCPINTPEPEQYGRWLLLRRSVSDPTDVAYFVCGGPPETDLLTLVRVAGQRWPIEECFALAKGDCGLDEYEVRSWTGWYRHITLSLFALAMLSVIRARAIRSPGRKKGVRV